jgi:hypothetical protein
MRKVYKYPLETTDEQTLTMPKGAKVLTVQNQGEQACIWAVVDLDAPVNERRTFFTYGTGYPMQEPDVVSEEKYIGTYQLMGGGLVFHVFEHVLRDDL